MTGLAAALVGLVLLAPAVAGAQCTVTATPIAFGTYLPFAATPTDNTGNVTSACAFNGYTIALNAGINGGGNFANRRMASAGAFLLYQLYSDAAHATVWGDGTGGTSTVAAPCLFCRRTHTVFGRITARQAARPGTYSDTILVTVTF